MNLRQISALFIAFGLSACNDGNSSGTTDPEPRQQPELIGDGPTIRRHLDQAEIVAGEHSFAELFQAGRHLFSAKFNRFDGQGRPATTGGGAPRNPAHEPPTGFLRTSGTDANACAGCHNEPRVGGSGDFVANVFVLAQTLDPVTFDVSAANSNERNTLGMFGAGAIELLGREMTDELQRSRNAALEQAQLDGTAVSVELSAKGVSFGRLTANPDGSIDTDQIEGIDADLIIKPFHQKGVVRSLREFTVNAMNHHHGMQATERFGVERTGSDDFDQDGVADELTVGDITAATLFQAALAVPQQILTGSAAKQAAISVGEQHFEDVGCATCHTPALSLESSMFCEPYARNPEGTFANANQAYCFDLTQQGEAPLLSAETDGTIIVRAYTDLKRHVICDSEKPHYCNELIEQAGVPTDQFITRKLWDVGNSGPWGHRGDLTTLTDAVLAHGGEARDSRLAFEALSTTEQAELIEFLKSLQTPPTGGLME